MTIGRHVSEIVRQGIWASLTGGWCYEPTNSIFCNTVHLYTWATLMLAPLLIGIFTSGIFSWVVLSGYVCFIVVLFASLKLIIFYLHRVFDTTEPIVKLKKDKSDKKDDAPVESGTVAFTSDEDDDSIMQAMDAIPMSEYRHCSIIETDSPNRPDPLLGDGPFGNLKSIHEDDSCSSTSSKASDSALLDKSKPQKAVGVTENDVIMPADSFELIPKQRRSSINDLENATPSTSSAFNANNRKLSAPNFEIHQTRNRNPIRRRDSTSNASMRRGPGNASADASHQYQRRLSAYYHRDSKRRRGVSSEKSKSEEPAEVFIEDDQQPCCSKDIPLRRPINVTQPDFEVGSSSRSRSQPQRSPDVIEVVPVDEPTSSEVALLANGEDLKDKITQFLEELIDKHPETLDVIESVRQSRLGRGGTIDSVIERPGTSATTTITTITSNNPGVPSSSLVRSNRNRGSSTLPSGVSINASLREGTHVAYDHEDTTEGAVHSFQDEHGTWWTYTFRDGGPGVAHPLGSTRAIYELFSQRNEAPSTNALYRATHRRHASAAGAMSSSDGTSSSLSRHNRSSRRSESISMDKPFFSVTYIDPRSETGVPDPLGVATAPELEQEPSKRRRRRRGYRTRSNSSEGTPANDYISNNPVTVFHPNTNTNATDANNSQNGDSLSIHRQFISIAQLASRLYTNNVNTHPPATSTPAGTHSSTTVQMRQPRTTLESFAGDRRRRVQDATDIRDRDRARNEYLRLEMANREIQTMTAMRLINELGPISNRIRYPPRHASQPKVNHYYRLKPFSLGQGFQIKFHRLEVAALFDRNLSMFSCFFDVFLSAATTILAALLIARGIYADFSLIFFAVVVAGAQFSLLKSVQPDASSPVHGFNWLVTYSRPAYFCFLGSVVLFLDLFAVDFTWETSTMNLASWNWNLYTLHTTSKSAVIIGFRDLTATLLLCLPLAFMIGLLPMITTLCMHVIEQIDVHLLGGTASFSLFSASMALVRSLMALSVLTMLGHFAWLFDSAETQNAVFAAFTAIIISTAFLFSRWSTNPLFLNIVIGAIKKCLSFRCVSENTETSDDNTTELNSANVENLPKHLKNPVMDSIKKEDPMPQMIVKTLIARIHNDVFYAVLNSLIVFALHCTSVFTTTQPYFEFVITVLCIFFGILNHYIYPQLRSHLPWKILEKPVLKPKDYEEFEVTTEAKLETFERLYVWSVVIEKKVLYQLLIVSYLSSYAWIFPIAAAPLLTVFATVLCSFRLSRAAFCHPQLLYVPLIGTFVLANWGYNIFRPIHLRERLPSGSITSVFSDSSIYITPLIVFYCFVTIWPKIQEFSLKLNFVLAYIAPWQISWGSAFHAFAQPFSLPHSGLVLMQMILSSIISAPLNPFLGSSFFLMSYVRPIKFWEKDYNTKHTDPFKIRLINQLERGPMVDDSNFNAVFYEHLTRNLQKYLAGDLLLGRWSATIHPGDCFVLASTNFNCLVHIIEVGNGFVTFQIRGLEFRGTYCHQREIEAITEDSSDSGSFCCCSVKKIPGFLSFNTMFTVRWLAWEVTTAKYIIDGYSISDNSAVNILQVYELRRLLVTFYVKCIVFYMITSPNFEKWLNDETIQKVLEPVVANPRYAEYDTMFSAANDDDFDMNCLGLTRQSFADVHGRWIRHCYERRLADNPTETAREHNLIVSFCFLMSVLGRRSVGAQPFTRHCNAAETYLCGLHAIFKGDVRVTGSDEWVLCDPEILLNVITPAVKMAMKLHQDHFASSDDLENPSMLYEKIEEYHMTLFISHEHDPTWRQAIISNTPSLLALRHMYDDGQDDYKVIMLNRSTVNMRVIKLNRECVRAFWAGQQQELIFFRNRNPERGSIQNARQVLRNMINSSADQPVGYPIYVSPLMTSFVDNHPHVERILGSSINFCTIAAGIRRAFGRLVHHFGTSGSSNLPSGATGSANTTRDIPLNVIGPTLAQAGSTPAPYRKRTATGSVGAASALGLAGSITTERGPVEDGASLKTSASATVSAGPQEVASKASASLKRPRRRESIEDSPSVEPETPLAVPKKSKEPPLVMAQTSVWSDTLGHEMFAEIVDKTMILPRLNELHRSMNDTLVQWPSETWRKNGGRYIWPIIMENGMRASVAHVWRPFQVNRAFRSHAGVIYLLRVTSVEGYHAPLFVPINEAGIKFIDKADFFAGIAAETAAATAAKNETVTVVNIDTTPIDKVSIKSGSQPSSDTE